MSSIFFEGGLRFGLLAIAVVHFAGMAAQLFNLRGAQAGVGEGVDEHIQQGNELGVVEGLLVVVAEPVIELDFSETQQVVSCVCGRVVFGFGRGGWMVAVAVAPCNGGSSSAGRRSVMLRAWPGTREISPRRSRVKII
jgi:hypothetical protein